MKKFLCCLLALMTLGVGTATAVSCGGGNADNSSQSSESSESSSATEKKVVFRLPKKTYIAKREQAVDLGLVFKIDGVGGDWSALTFTSANPSVATVSNDGIVTGVSVGKTQVTVSYEEKTLTADVSVVAETTAENVNTFSEDYVNIYGRSYVSNEGLYLNHAASSIEVGFIGSSLSVTIASSVASKMRVFVDGETSGTKIDLEAGERTYTVAENLTDGLHTVRIVKGTEELWAQWRIISFAADKFFAMPEKSDLKIEFIGSSDSTGYGIYGSPGQEGTVANSDCTRAYPYLTAQALNADYSVVAMTGICTSVCFWAGDYKMETLYEQVCVTNPTSYAFDFNPDIVVVNLGSIEASYMTRDDEENSDLTYSTQFSTDYQRFLSAVREKNPNAYIICLYGMIQKNMGVHNGIRVAVGNLADDKIVYNPFTIKEDTSGAIHHPGSQAHKKWAEDLTAYIQTLDINGD